MAKAKVIMDYSTNRYSDSEFGVKTETIATNLTDNPDFPTLKDKATEIKTQGDIYRGWLARMPEGNKQVTLAKNQSRALLEGLLSDTALKVQDLSGGDEKLILSTGFDVKRKPTPVGLLERIDKVVANPGPRRGSLEISWDVVANAYLYEMQYTEAPSTDDSKWIHTSNTKRKIVIDGLTRGKAYAIKVAAAGSDPGRVWSDEIISYVM
jgi:hypothetical protein